ncbi:MAG: hypothetical protein ACFFAY_09855 [Promethearchaeota archaeon]
MKPLGTITMCFPYVDEVTRHSLQLVMDDSENFGDFAERLCEKVCLEESPPLLEYLAFFFPFHMEHFYLTDRLKAAARVPDLAEPLYLITTALKGTVVKWDEMRQSLRKALAAAPNDWIATHLYLRWRYLADEMFPECDVNLKPINALTRNVNENAELEFFKSHLIRIQAQTAIRENKRKEAIEQLSKAITIARRHDDQIVVAALLIYLANQIKHSNLKRAIDILLGARDLSKQLGYRYNIGHIQHELGHILAFRGELNAAFEHQLEYQRVSESVGYPEPSLNALLALYLNQMGNGAEALGLATIAVENSESYPRLEAFIHSQLAYALINLERFEEAKSEIALTQETATKSGDTTQFRWFPIVEGILDKAEGRFDAAIDCFRTVLDGIKEDSDPLIQNICLLNLADMEIAGLSGAEVDRLPSQFGPWMKALEDYVQKNDFPGIAAQSLIIKAKLYHKLGKFDEVRRTIKEVQRISEAPSMRYLNDFVLTAFPDIVVS